MISRGRPLRPINVVRPRMCGLRLLTEVEAKKGSELLLLTLRSHRVGARHPPKSPQLRTEGVGWTVRQLPYTKYVEMLSRRSRRQWRSKSEPDHDRASERPRWSHGFRWRDCMCV